MGAGRSPRNRVQRFSEGLLLLRAQHIALPSGGVTRKRCAYTIELGKKPHRGSLIGAGAPGRKKLLGQSSHEGCGILARKERGDGAHRDRIIPERLKLKAQAQEGIRCGRSSNRLGHSHRDNQGRKKSLARHPTRSPACTQSLVQHPLVRGVLIDQHETVLAFEHEVGGEELTNQAKVGKLQREGRAWGRERLAGSLSQDLGRRHPIFID